MQILSLSLSLSLSLPPAPLSPSLPLSLLPLTQAGSVKDMNEFAQRFMSEAGEREGILSEAAAVAESHDDPK